MEIKLERERDRWTKIGRERQWEEKGEVEARLFQNVERVKEVGRIKRSY